jgi:hypothetical protein
VELLKRYGVPRQGLKSSTGSFFLLIHKHNLFCTTSSKSDMTTDGVEHATIRVLQAAEIDALLKILKSALPYSLPLFRRLQYQRRFPSPTEQILVVYKQQEGVPQSNEDLTVERIAWLIPPGSTWLAAYVDLDNPGQTGCWLYGSWEHPDSQHNKPIEQSLVTSLFSHILNMLVPQQPDEPKEEWCVLRDSGKYLSQPYNKKKVLFGTVNDIVRQYFPEAAIQRIDPSYGKYIFDTTLTALPATALPEGYSFGPMTEDLLQTVLDRSPIPRTLRTLKAMLNVGLYYDGKAIGWGFVGKDGSVSSLHTEPEHRGRSLAVAVGCELIRRQGEVFGPGGLQYADADVSDKNAASNSVMKKMGGTVRWKVAWIEIDLAEALRTLNTSIE